jgi:hypothetical protein
MGGLTRENVTEEQFIKIVYYFAEYHKSINEGYRTLGFAKRALIKKRVNDINKFYEELDAIN